MLNCHFHIRKSFFVFFIDERCDAIHIGHERQIANTIIVFIFTYMIYFDFRRELADERLDNCLVEIYEPSINNNLRMFQVILFIV